MLVLSRKAGESIMIDDVKVTVVKLDRNRVRIGIEAPAEKKILRGELVFDDLMDNLTNGLDGRPAMEPERVEA